MKISIFTKDDDPASRSAKELGLSLKDEGYIVSEIDLESDEAEQLANLYQIFNLPALLVTTDDGSYIDMWQGDLPLLADVKHRVSNV